MAVGTTAGQLTAASRSRSRLPSVVPWILPVLLLLGWQLTLTFGVFKEYQLPPPLKVITSAANLWERGLLQQHIVTTLLRTVFGFGIGVGFALVLGTVNGLSRTADRFFDSTLQAARTVPTLAWSPLLILWMGIDEPPKLTLVAIGAFFPVYLNLVAVSATWIGSWWKWGASTTSRGPRWRCRSSCRRVCRAS